MITLFLRVIEYCHKNAIVRCLAVLDFDSVFPVTITWNADFWNFALPLAIVHFYITQRTSKKIFFCSCIDELALWFNMEKGRLQGICFDQSTLKVNTCKKFHPQWQKFLILLQFFHWCDVQKQRCYVVTSQEESNMDCYTICIQKP